MRSLACRKRSSASWTAGGVEPSEAGGFDEGHELGVERFQGELAPLAVVEAPEFAVGVDDVAALVEEELEQFLLGVGHS